MSTHLPAGGPGDLLVWLVLGGARVGTVLWGGLVVIDVAGVVGVPSYAVPGALAALVGLASLGTRPSTALGSALVGWLLVDGFVEHRYGILGFSTDRDPFVLALLVGLALGATRITRTAPVPRPAPRSARPAGPRA